MSDQAQRSNELISRSNSRLVIIDVQEKLVPHIADHEAVVANCRRLIEGATIFDVPVTATEQYPKGLGPTVAELSGLSDPKPQKLRFSAAECLDWSDSEQDSDPRDQVVVAGIEAHVCVLQTCLDLASVGFRVFAVADAIGSRQHNDRDTAINRMRDCGVMVVSTESVLFEWCEVAGTPEFKQISRLVTERKQ